MIGGFLCILIVGTFGRIRSLVFVEILIDSSVKRNPWGLSFKVRMLLTKSSKTLNGIFNFFLVLMCLRVCCQ